MSPDVRIQTQSDGGIPHLNRKTVEKSSSIVHFLATWVAGFRES
jgi:hypothetical protein